MVEFHKKPKSLIRDHSSVSVSDDVLNLDSASINASEVSSPLKKGKVNQLR